MLIIIVTTWYNLIKSPLTLRFVSTQRIQKTSPSVFKLSAVLPEGTEYTPYDWMNTVWLSEHRMIEWVPYDRVSTVWLSEYRMIEWVPYDWVNIVWLSEYRMIEWVPYDWVGAVWLSEYRIIEFQLSNIS